MGPCCLYQPNKESPIVPCANSPLVFRVLLPSHVAEPLLDVFGTHAGCTRCSAIGELTDDIAQFIIRRDIVVDLDWGDIEVCVSRGHSERDKKV